ncbi:unnamed protein product [Leptosia nina]|uniref:KRAB-A domain-containing protein 2 n=1 Tax=Leptosia nina TaxID=320188 RepID=A0AAV1JY97_9NEOP
MDATEQKCKERFEARLRDLLSTKGQNSHLFTKKHYLETIEKVKASKKKTTGKKPEDYQRLKRYDVLTIGNIEKLIVPVKQTDLIKFYVHTEELFDIIHEQHKIMGHVGRTKMGAELNLRFKNVTREMISLYLSVCPQCEKKTTKCTKPPAQECFSKGHIDIISMETDNEYKYILVYQDFETSFVQLRSLKTENVEEIANILLDIFTTFGAPCVLTNSRSRESLAESVVKHLHVMWPQVKMVHGLANHAQDLTDDIKQKLNTWLAGHSGKWTEGLRFVQFMMNSEVESGQSAFEALFGIKAQMGLTSVLPEDILPSVNSEEDLETYLTSGEVPVAVNIENDSAQSDIMKFEDQENALAGTSQDELNFDMEIKIEDSLILKMDHDALEL